MSRPFIRPIVICLILACTCQTANAEVPDFASPLYDSAVSGERTDREMEKKNAEEERKRQKRRDDEEEMAADDLSDPSKKGKHGDKERDQLRNAWTSDFTDTDFSTPSYQDLRATSETGIDGSKENDKRRDPDKLRRDDDKAPVVADKKKDDTSRALTGDDDDDMEHMIGADLEEKRIFKELTAPIPGMLHDWVPSDPDPIWNGGFINEADNGSPVPYRLNGHVDPERKLPWEKDPG